MQARRASFSCRWCSGGTPATSPFKPYAGGGRPGVAADIQPPAAHEPVVLHVLYLSLLYAGKIFMTYQWDVYLLEAGSSHSLDLGHGTGNLAVRWLLFRFMFMSGVVKLLSGDPSWAICRRCPYHFLTQPLPTPLAWYASQLPAVPLRLATGLHVRVELVLPFLIFCPRRMRFVAGFGVLLLQSCILVTGNYNWSTSDPVAVPAPVRRRRFAKALPHSLIRRLPAQGKPEAAERCRSSSRTLALLIVFSVSCKWICVSGAIRPRGAESGTADRAFADRQRLRPVRGHDHRARRNRDRGVGRRRRMAGIRIPV